MGTFDENADRPIGESDQSLHLNDEASTNDRNIVMPKGDIAPLRLSSRTNKSPPTGVLARMSHNWSGLQLSGTNDAGFAAKVQ